MVRVRLQSQSASSSRAIYSTTTFNNLPPNLGVTACCREVFWVNNNSPVCLAADSAIPAISTIASSSSTPAVDCAIDESRRKTFNSTFDGLRKIARYEGLSSLWRGLSPTLVMAVPGNVIYFTGYDYLRFNAHSPINTYVPEAYSPLVAGSIARTAAAIVISPIEMFRTRLQATTSSSSGKGVFTETLIGLKTLVNAQGYTSLWRGFTLTMWRDVPFSGFYWWGYEAVRNALTAARNPTHQHGRPRSGSRSSEDHTTTFVDSFISGAISGAVAAIITTPFDVGKTRKQVIEHSPSAANIESTTKSSIQFKPEELSMPRFLHQIWMDEGAAGLFRGWAARCLKVAPACAIMISSYEIGNKIAKSLDKTNIAKAQD